MLNPEYGDGIIIGASRVSQLEETLRKMETYRPNKVFDFDRGP